MPFKRRGKYYYHKGKRYTKRQVKFYYASKGTWRKRRTRRKKRK